MEKPKTFLVDLPETVIYSLMDHLEDMVSDYQDEPEEEEWVAAREAWRERIIDLETRGIL